MRVRIILISLIYSRSPGSSSTSSRPGAGEHATDTGLNVVAAENFYGDIAKQIGGPDVTRDLHPLQPERRPAPVRAGNGQRPRGRDRRPRHPERARLRRFHAEARGGCAEQPPGRGHDLRGARLPRRRHEPAHLVRRPEAPPHRSGDRVRARARRSLRTPPPTAPALPASMRACAPSSGRSRRSERALRASLSPTPSLSPATSIAAAGLRNLAPASFTRAIEDGSEPSPQSVAQMTALTTKRQVKVLLYNSQAVSPITSRIRAAAEQRRDSRDRDERDDASAPDPPILAARRGQGSTEGAVAMSSQARGVVSVQGLALRFGERTLWEDLSFELG